ncbi:MAG: AraC family transcriptional regulator, partial [Bacteroidetes bacterium]|nr:AraC family transcriptional regulator [Bacteroidota bacterium]
FSPFFLQSTQEKQALLERVMNDLPQLITEHREGWLTPAWFHQIFRHVVSIFFWILSARLLYILFRVKQPGYYKENKVKLRWLSVFVILQFFFFAPAVLLMLTGHTDQALNANYIPIVIMDCITCTYLFFHPVIFYGMPGVFYPLNLHAIRGKDEEAIEETSIKDDQSVDAPNRVGEFKRRPKMLTASSTELVILADLGYMTAEEVHQLGNMIGEYIESHQPFLDGGYDINSFAKDIGIPVRKLSSYINNVEGINYRDFMNLHRVLYCVRNLKEGSWQDYTLNAISQECGFGNRNSFTLAFKKVMKMNPSDFLKQQKPHTTPLISSDTD